MTRAQENYRRVLLSRLHMQDFVRQSKQFGAWGDYLYALYGVNSAAYLSIPELLNLLDIIAGRTDKPTRCGERPRADNIHKAHKKPERITAKQIWKINQLWGERERTKLLEFIHRQTGEYYLDLEPLNKQQGTKIITGLKKLLKKE